MDIEFRLLTVTSIEGNKNPFSVPVGQITGISHGRFQNSGRFILSSGGHIDTVETYDELVTMYRNIT